MRPPGAVTPILEPTRTPEYRAAAKMALKTALSSAPAYKSWRRYDCDLDEVFARYAALPALTKADLRDHPLAEFVTESRLLDSALASGEVTLVKTSGSTSEAITNVWYQPWWDASEVASWKLNRTTAAAGLGAHREAILSSPRCVGFACNNGYLSMEQRMLGRFLFLTEKDDPAEWGEALCDRMIDELGRFEPLVLEANPSFLSVLCRHAIKHKRRVYQPAAVTLTFENPSLIHLRHIQNVFQCPTISSYGSTECAYVFMQCEAGRYHQNVEHCHVDFQPLAPRHGGPLIGRILVSTFHNPWRALIRFDIGDLVRLATKPCPCGRHAGLTLEAVEGRVTHTTLSSAGRLITQAEVDAVIAQIAGIEQYELVQSDRTTVSVRYVSDSRAPAALEPELCASLRRCYGARVKIVPRQVPALSPIMGVKYRLAGAEFKIDINDFIASEYERTKVNISACW